MKILKLGAITFLFGAGIASCLKHNEESKSDLEGDKTNFAEFHHHNLTHEEYFEKLKNLTDGEKEKMRPLKLCGSLFMNKPSQGHDFTTCLAELKSKVKAGSSSEEDDKPHRKKRDAFIRDMEMDHGFSSDFELTNPAHEDNHIVDYKDANIKLKPRRKRERGTHIPVHHKRGHWNIYDSPHVRRNPCVVSCILGKQGLINSSGDLDIDAVLERVENLLSTANTTEPKLMASRIVNLCIAQQHEIERNKELSDDDDMAQLKCRSHVQITKCLSRDVFVACRNGFGTANLVSTSTGKSV